MRDGLLVLCVSCVLLAGVQCGPSESLKARKRAAKAHVEKLKSYVDPEVLKTVDPDFFTYPGFRDWFRFPLVYPYQVEMVDELDLGALNRVRSGAKIREGGARGDIVRWLTHLSFDGKFLVGRVYSGRKFAEPKPADIYWIVFEFASGEYERFDSKGEAVKYARDHGFTGDERLESLRTHYDRCP